MAQLSFTQQQQQDHDHFVQHIHEQKRALAKQTTKFLLQFCTLLALSLAVFFYCIYYHFSWLYMIPVIVCWMWVCNAICTGVFAENVYAVARYLYRCNRVLRICHLTYCDSSESLIPICPSCTSHAFCNSSSSAADSTTPSKQINSSKSASP
eukprot:TRINITY_DN670_c0_g3_i1.p1 TRINITY_DN670_c0_g3~~TRINITY_DN670_c0_g3_i1.p1  ORF type:complete len:152 (-),score=11.25 TRINITY_DN670_c0_g3_i1:314-769(-)